MKNRLFRLALGFLMSVFLWTNSTAIVEADTYTEMMSQFPGVTVSDTGRGWTTDYGLQVAERHPYGYSFSTGATSTVQTPGPGEHYYEDEATGVVPISKWTLMHVPAQCIHQSDWPDEKFYGFSYHEGNCGLNYSSGWFATCANCNEYIPFLIYARESTVQNITFIPAASGYAYMCPYCDNMEQGVPYTHMCNSFISKNYYQVQYISNFPADATRKAGWMGMTKHMVDNATMYNGKPASDPQYGYTDTHLRKNSFIAEGYVFTGWNTERDGSGTAYTDEQAINLCPDENGATIRLFAQWRRVTSTLKINANGGSYAGYTGPITQGYGSTWTFSASKVTAPSGPKVTFNHMGGTGTAYINSTKSYAGKSISTPTHGLLVDDTYTFLGNNTTDTITLQFSQNSITLPTSSRPGYSFGGWYADFSCTVPVGVPGTTYTPSGNVTLYAKWVSLILTSVDDYTSNSGKGAVDLTWSQTDGADKTYQIYQYSEVNGSHRIINSATDIGTTNSVNKSFGYSGASQTYTVPYSGYYTLTLNGAQGGNYDTFTGGLGGRTTATIYLKAGEVLTYNIGSQSGYNGGGTGSDFGTGGGYSSVSSNLKGTLLIAGGGGGAGAQSNGYAGGDGTSVITGNTGEAGMAGGGGGYQGGTAGEYIVHNHLPECMHSDPLDYMWYYDSAVGSDVPDYLSAEAQVYYEKNSQTDWTDWKDWKCGLNVGQLSGDNGYGQARHFLSSGGYNYEMASVDVGYVYDFDSGTIKSYDFIPTKGNTEVFISARATSSNSNSGLARKDHLDLDYTALMVYDQNNNLIYHKKASDLQYIDGYDDWTDDVQDPDFGTFWSETGQSVNSYRGTVSALFDIRHDANVGIPYACWNETISLPEGTTGIRIVCRVKTTGAAFHTSVSIECIEFTGGVDEYPICGYTEGQVLSSKGAYGGSNYVNSAYCQSYTSESGKQTGDGAFSIVSTTLGFNDSTTLNDVVAPDMAKPNAVAMASVVKTSRNKTTLRVSFDKPADKGTKYYHYVKSYSAITGAYSLTSNTTLNTLTTGVVEYHYVYDTSSSTTVTTSHTSTANQYIDVTLPASGTKYLHVAAADKAGNISSTIHIPIKAAGQDVSVVCVPKPITEQLGITMGDGVATGADAKTFYVRSDGLAVIELKDKAYLTDDGSRALAQVDTVRLNVCNPSYGIYEWAESLIPYAPGSGSYSYGNSDLQTNASAQNRMPLSGAEAARVGKDSVTVAHRYTIPSAYDGHTFLVYPKAYTTYQHRLYSSVDSADRNNYLKLICDGTPPVINGLDAIEDMDALNMTEVSKTFTITASDSGSGLADFAVTVDNQDNFITKTFRDEDDGAKDGVITITVPKYVEGSMDGLEFCGEFEMSIKATDNVGNMRVESRGSTGLALTAKLERILEPHEPVFKRGESGILTITTWGYVERVEAEFVDLLNHWNKTYDYTGNLQYVQEEKIQFMIPLNLPDGEYEVKVTGYKAGTDLERNPVILTFTVRGSVLDELRTRLR